MAQSSVSVSLDEQLKQHASSLKALRAFDQRIAHWRQQGRIFSNPPQVLHAQANVLGELDFDVAIAGGTLGIILGAALVKQGWRVAVIERGRLQGRDQEWNISRRELAVLLELELITSAQLEEAIATENSESTDAENTDEATDSEAVAAASEADLDELLDTVPEIDDSLSLAMMQTYLYRELSDAWTDRVEDQTASYRLSVATDGAIVGYEAIDGTPEDAVNSTPLTELAYSSVDDAIAGAEEVGQFKVVFDDKVLEVSPWQGSVGDIAFDSSDVRGQALKDLVTGIRRDITENLDGRSVATDRPLRYSIGVTDDGAIAFYISESASAETAVSETPLPDLIQPEAAGIIPGTSILPQEALTQINVVFQPNGVVEVSPWAGYR